MFLKTALTEEPLFQSKGSDSQTVMRREEVRTLSTFSFGCHFLMRRQISGQSETYILKMYNTTTEGFENLDVGSLHREMK